MPCVWPDPLDKDAEPFVEVDPTGRYGRYADLLGTGATKKVYRGFDQEEGIEVAWNQVRLRCFKEDPQMLDRLFSEVRLLRSLRHENIITLYNVWMDDEAGTLNFITEVCTSGDLREYRKKHRHVSVKALKKWSRQILAGLDYLHNHDPCIIHRDLNCSNVFMNGNSGKVHTPPPPPPPSPFPSPNLNIHFCQLPFNYFSKFGLFIGFVSPYPVLLGML